MQNFKFYLEGNLVNPPYNWQDLETELSFENGNPQVTLNATKLQWMADEAKILNDWYNLGLYGGLGIFEGPDLQITACTTEDNIFTGIADMTDIETAWNCDIVTTKIKDMRVDTVKELLYSISFGALADPNAFPGNPGPYSGAWIDNRLYADGGDIHEVLYQNNNVPDFVTFFTMVLAIYNMVLQAIQIAEDIAATISGIVAAATVAGAGAIALGVVELIGELLALILILIALVNLFEMAMDYIISPVYSKLGNSPLTMMQRACAYFGIKFKSSILENDPWDRLIHLPVKRCWDINQSVTRSVYLGFLSTYNTNQRMMYDEIYNFKHGGYAYGYPDGTVGQYLDDLATFFRAQARIILDSSGNPTLYLEREDYFYNLSTLTLPPISDQAPFKNSYVTNASELNAFNMVEWQTDGSDVNTLHYYQGTSCYYQCYPKTVKKQKNVTLQNLKYTTLPYAHAQRKDKLTAEESIFNKVWNDFVFIPNVILTPLSKITKWIKKYWGTAPTINPLPTSPYSTNILGIMYLTNHVTSVPKMLIRGSRSTFSPMFKKSQQTTLTGWNIDPNNKGLVNMSYPNLSARSLKQHFHYIDDPISVYPPAYPWSGTLAASRAGQTYYNQWRIYNDQVIPFCCSDYETVLNNNFLYDNSGRIGKFIKFSPQWFKGTAKVNYKIQDPYTYNLQASYVVDGVQKLSAL